MAADLSAHTPMKAQYLRTKAGFPATRVFDRMGDVRELFYDDARKAERLLDIMITTQGQSAGQPVVMAGVPGHSSAVAAPRTPAGDACRRQTQPLGCQAGGPARAPWAAKGAAG